MASGFRAVLLVYSALQTASCLGTQTQHRDGFRRNLLQANSHAPLQVWSNGEPCVLLWFRRLTLRHEEQQLDLTERIHSPTNPVDLSRSSCSRDRARMVLRFGDVKDVKDLSISLSLSSSEVEASGERWFSLDSVLVQFNSTQRLVFNSTQIYSPESASFSCEHISSLHKYNGLLSSASSASSSSSGTHRWDLTFTHFQIQAFGVSSGVFSRPVDCATFLTPALLMGLLCSLILLLVLAYAFHLLLHLRDLEDHERSCPSLHKTQHHCSAQKYLL